jgi:16S rRNA processing protein RimM
MESGSGWKTIKVLSARFISGRPALRIDAIETPEDAGNLTNRYLYIKADELGQLPEGSYYHFDLIGCLVTDTEGKTLGELVDIESYPANDAWVIETDEGKQVLFPAVKEFVVEVDLEKNLIVINPPEGIFDSPDED